MSVALEKSNDIELESEKPWRDKEVLYDLYWNERLSQREIGDVLGKSQQTISRWMDRLGIDSTNDVSVHYEIEERDGEVTYEKWRYGTTSIYVHRLLAVAEYGFEAVIQADHVHHKDAWKFDNRPDNLELVTHAEHGTIHSNDAEFVMRDGYPQLTIQ